MDNHTQINRFLVEVFHTVLRAEERELRRLGGGNLSINEAHVIEAVGLCQQQGCHTAKGIAAQLGITPGSLTAAINVLERKGYVQRIPDPRDRRRVQISLTSRGQAADEGHQRIHQQLVAAVTSDLNEEETAILLRALQSVAEFFNKERTAPK